MTMKIGIKELVKNSSILSNYDYIELEDKKTHELKGLFISPKYAKEFQSFLDEKISKEKQIEPDEMMHFVGIFDGDFSNMTTKEMRALHASKYVE